MSVRGWASCVFNFHSGFKFQLVNLIMYFVSLTLEEELKAGA